MSARSVKLVYVSGNNNMLLKAASYLMTIRMAYYYSKDFIRFKSRRDEVEQNIAWWTQETNATMAKVNASLSSAGHDKDQEIGRASCRERV